MKNKLFSLGVALFLLLAATASVSEESANVEDYNLSGRWKVLLSNSLSRKQVTFDIDHKDGRLRGDMSASGVPGQKLDGRIEDDLKIFLWGTHQDRSGATFDYEFKGRVEGEPGKEKLVGKSEFFRKRYKFVGVRATKKKKKRR